jgi:hypothetical protein
MSDETVGMPVLILLREAARGSDLSKREQRSAYEVCNTTELLRLLAASCAQEMSRPAGKLEAFPRTPETVARLELVAARKTCDLLQARLDNLKTKLADLRSDRDRWRQQAEQAMRLLSAPRRRHRSLWQWLLGQGEDRDSLRLP